MSNLEFIETSREGGVASILMKRPPLNVLNIAMMEELNTALEAVLSRDDVAAVVFHGAGKAFSAGVDVADHAADKVADMVRLFHGIFRKLVASDVLSISAVNGAALGGGCELACFCDIVLASSLAKFGQPEVKLGVFPPVAACILPEQIGLKRALELTTLGNVIDAGHAHRIGMVNQLFEASEFDDQVAGYLDQVGKLSRPVLRLAKRATSGPSRERILRDLGVAEDLYLSELMKLEDAHEGVAAFTEKRPAAWKHR